MTAINVIMPVLGMSQDTGLVVKWLVEQGATVHKGQVLLEIETDKAMAEIESPADGVLLQILSHEGEIVPVGQDIALITPLGEVNTKVTAVPATIPVTQPEGFAIQKNSSHSPVSASPMAVRMAAEHNIDLNQVHPKGRRIEKADILAYLQTHPAAPSQVGGQSSRTLASPKARRLAKEQGLDLRSVPGSGPQGAILANDVSTFQPPIGAANAALSAATDGAYSQISTPVTGDSTIVELPLSNVGRIMAERTTATWQSAPHFYLLREVDAGQLLEWRERAQKNSTLKITLTDLLIKLSAYSLAKRPALNVQFQDNKLLQLPNVNVGFAAAVDDGLVVPVIRNADQKSLSEITQARITLLDRGRAGRLRLEDIAEGSFTISNLGMFGVDAFNAIINGSQAAILAVGRVAERVIARAGQPVVRPTVILSLSCDHRVVDGAHAAEFLDTLAGLIEDPLQLVS